MSIRELEPKNIIPILNIRIGSKLGRALKVGEHINLWVVDDIAFGGVYGQRVEIKTSNRVRLISFNDNAGLTIVPIVDLEGEEINKNPDIKRKLRWIPD